MSASSVATAAFFALLFSIGLAIHDDYGVSYDEWTSRENSVVSAIYVLEVFGLDEWIPGSERHAQHATLEEYGDADYPVAFELAVLALEVALGLDDPRQTFLLRHIANFLAFFVGVLCLCLTARRRFSGSWLPLLGGLCLVASPPIFSHAFYNSKDLVFLSAVSVALWTLVWFTDRPGIGRALVHALATALAMNVRVAGIWILLVTPPMLWPLGSPADSAGGRKRLRAAGVYLLGTSGLVYLLWPWLWENPLRFFEAMTSALRFRWTGRTLYLGRYLPADGLPWHYLPVWIAISTPVAYTVFFLAGAVMTAREIPRFSTDRAARLDILFLFLFAGPLLAAILLGAHLYDGWRHLFFVYPAFLLVSLRGFGTFWRGGLRVAKPLLRYARIAVLLAAGGELIGTAVFMVKSHPHQHVYFSCLGADFAERSFEADYWGLAYRPALEYILAKDHSDRIRIKVEGPPGLLNSMILPAKERARLSYVDLIEDASYYIGGYRYHRGPYGHDREVFHVRVGGIKIISVFDLR